MAAVIVQVNTPPLQLRDDYIPVVMTVGGSDPTGRAGIEADVKTITAHKCYATTCTTALTVQTLAHLQETPRDVIAGMLDANLHNMKCNVIKTGMLTEDAIAVLAEKLTNTKKPLLVVEPDKFCDVAMLIKLTPLADLLICSVDDCIEFTGNRVVINSHLDLLSLATEVAAKTSAKNMLLKGGCIPNDDENNDFIDLLYMQDDSKYFVYKGNYLPATNTGSTLASSVASNLAHGYSLPQAVYGGIEYVQNASYIGCQVTKKSAGTNGSMHHLYSIQIPLETTISDGGFSEHSSMPIPKGIDIGNDFFTYLINHPTVKPHWDAYTNHPFVLEVAKGRLDLRKMQFYTEQDYSYLVDYARILCIAASKSPTLEDIENEIWIVSRVRYSLSLHERRLKEVFGVKDSSYFETIKRGPALRAYSRYFDDVAKYGNWQELLLALNPCMMGYGTALINVKDQITCDEGSVYRDWCNTYTSDRCKESLVKGAELLNRIARTYPNKINKLVQIYADVCELETNFWTAALEH